MTEIRTGDCISFRAGRGYATGTVANVSAGKVLINTMAGKSVTRKLLEVSLVEAPARAEAPAPVVSETPATMTELDDL